VEHYSCPKEANDIPGGISEGIILAKIRAGGVAAKPSTEHIVAMKQAGVSDRVIEGMLAATVPVVVPPERRQDDDELPLRG
jgi:hypothetical protein